MLTARDQPGLGRLALRTSSEEALQRRVKAGEEAGRSGHSAPDNRATAVGWTSGMGRFGAVFGPWLGGRLLAANHGDWGFTAFALAGVSSMVFIGVAALRSSKQPSPSGTQQELLTTG